MKQCEAILENGEPCKAQVEEKYKFCMACAQRMKKTNEAVGAVKGTPGDIAEILSKINSNLYALRTIKEYELEELYAAKLTTNKETKRFEIETKKRKVKK